MTTFLDYPILEALYIEMTWRPIWSGEQQEHQSGGEYRFSYWDSPLWEWDLQYELLREGFRTGQAWDELRQIVGLFNACQGPTLGFRFLNPDDNQVVRQLTGTTDGTTTTFDLVRSYGANNPFLGYTSMERIGFLDQTKPFNLYVDSSPVPVSPSDPVYGYTFDLDTPSQQQLMFNTAPPNGHTIYVDMAYRYYVRFKDTQYDFDKFLQNVWALKKVTLRSLRQEAVT
jgi:hypothetical protein